LSPASYNGRARLALVCPITSQVKGYPFEVLLPRGLPIAGVVLADHLRSIDWQARRADPVGVAPPDVVEGVLARLAPLLGRQ
jgi:mRNA interferase MazF